MIKYFFIIALVILNLIIICKITEKNETFKNETPSPVCDPDDADIRGSSIIECVQNCSVGGGENCNTDNNGNKIDLIAPAQAFLSNNPNIDINAPSPGDTINQKIAQQSTCLKKCLDCGWQNHGGNCKCSWSNICIQSSLNNYDEFKKTWESRDFRIGAIPEDKKITLTWEEKMTQSDIDNYILYIFHKDNIGQVLTKKITHADIVKNQNNCMYIVEDLLNNVQYGLQLNKISKHFPGKTKLVKTSNTIFGVPSEINLLNFSNVNNPQKECDSLAENLLDNFVGREFEINLG